MTDVIRRYAWALVATFATIACGDLQPAADATVAHDAAEPDGTAADASVADAGVRDDAAAGDAAVPPSTVHRAIVNLRPAFTDFSDLEPWIEGISHIRVWGGSRGMATYPTEEAVPLVLLPTPNLYSVVQDSEIDAILALQRLRGVRVVYAVNINDTLDNQRAFVVRLLTAGVDLAMLEMGNEIYLTKYRSGDTSALGVTRVWTKEQYVDEILDVWIPSFADFDLPMYIVAASHGGGTTPGDAIRIAWNETLRTALVTRPDRVDGVTFHRYAGVGTANPFEEEISSADFAFLGTFGDLPIAVTESGYYFATPSEEALDAAAAFWSAFRAALKPSDLFGVHLMYLRPGATGGSDSGSDSALALYDEHGRTAVGDRFDRWLTTGE